jgi:transcriptional regulator EpsA
MNARDFDSFNSPKKSTAVGTVENATRNSGYKRGELSPVLEACQPMDNDGDRFLRIVEQASRIASHRKLYELLQGEDIQRFIPHQVLISAWGDFGELRLQRDVISALPGLRTGLLNHCTMDGILQALHKRWLVQGRQPMLLDSTKDARLEYSDCDCTLHKFLQGRWSMLVHGVTNMRDGEVCLYLALHAGPIIKGCSVERFRQLVDPLITQIDVAFRRIAALESPSLAGDHESPASLRMLSQREEEILLLVSEGKTNIETSKILALSVFTVKNHMKRIMKKLNAGNRTEAVAKYRQMPQAPQKKRHAEKHCA